MKKAKKPVLLAGGILLLLLLLLFRLLPGRGLPAGEELLTNGSFAELTAEGLPAGWYTEAYFSAAGYTGFSLSQGPDGMQALSIVNYQKNDARIAQEAAVEPNSLYCLSGLICAQAEGGWGANLSIAGVYAAASDGVYDSQGMWQRVALYGRTGPEQHTLTVFARLGGYSGEALGQAQFAGLSLKKVEAVPEGAETALFYQPGQAAARAFPLDLRHALLAAFTALYALLVCACFRAKSLLGLMVLSLFSGALCLLFQAVGAPEPIEGARNVGAAMPYAPYVLYALLLATLAAALALGYRLAREREPVPLLCGRRPGERPAGVFLRDEAENHRRPRRLDGRDAALALGIAALYALGAYSHLGSAVSPQTAFTFAAAGERAVFDLGAPQADFRMLYMNGLHESGNGFTVELSQDGESWEPPLSCAVSTGALYQWFYVTGDGMPDARALSGRYVRLTAAAPGLTLLETLFRDAEGRPLAVTVEGPAGRDASALVDEPDTLEGEPGWYNGMYFDEIYHGRTGYEQLHRMPVYETTHPPLGKDLIMLGIALFGMTGFGWRFSGTLFGVLLVPLAWCFVRRLTRSPGAAATAGVLLALDFMRFSQSRLATIDIYGTFFILLGAYCMVWYCQRVLTDGVQHALLPMALGGIAFGLGCAAKWTGIYAGAGLAVLYLGVLWARRQQGRPGFWAEFRLAALGGVLFYVVLPLCIYLASYLPYWWRQPDFSLGDWWRCQLSMYSYHATLKATHPFESRWYTWLLGLRPVWYYRNGSLPYGMKASIAGMAGPVIWLVGLAALVGLLWHQVSGRGSRQGAAVLILYGTQLIPWMLVTRCTFLYHYFPSSMFCLAALALVLARMRHRDWARRLCAGLCAAAVVLFAVYYPALSGLPIPAWWADALEVMPSFGFY